MSIRYKHHWIPVINWANIKSISASQTDCYRKPKCAGCSLHNTNKDYMILFRFNYECSEATDLEGKARTFSKACSVSSGGYYINSIMFTVLLCSWRQMSLALLCQHWEQIHSLRISLNTANCFCFIIHTVSPYSCALTAPALELLDKHLPVMHLLFILNLILTLAELWTWVICDSFEDLNLIWDTMPGMTRPC